MSPQDALQQIRDLISSDCGGRRNDARIAEVRRLLSYMPADLTIYARGKCSSIQEWAEMYWSPRKHKRYTGGTRGLAVSIIGACDVVRRELERT
jgi:hypothetical protein